MKRPLLLFISIILQLSCNTTEPPPPDKTIILSLEEDSSIEVWINLITTNLQLPTTLTLKQNNQTRCTIHLVKADTLLYIDSLLPKTDYTFQASSIEHPVSSNKLSVSTMDTTSHNFTFQTWTFGEHSSSVLRDVAIINENNIWAVGEIYLNDSLGQPDSHPYGAIHWDGITWTPIKVPYHDFGSTNKFPRPLKTIVAFGEDSIYVTSSANLLKLEGDEWIEKAFFMRSIPFDGQVLKTWGTDGNNIFCVGRNGAIYSYNGILWWKMYSGTDSDINDIWGIRSINSNNYLILCAASNPLAGGEKKILRISNNKVDTLLWGTSRIVHSLWFDSEYKLFACGGGIFVNNHTGGWIEQEEPPFVFTERVRGNGMNDVFVVGHFGLITHYNGSSWRTYPEAAAALVYTSLDYKDNLMVSVGYTQTQGVLQFMRRE